VLKTWLWATGIVHGLDGWLDRVSPRHIAFAAEYHGDPQALYNALVNAGFIDLFPDGRAKLHHWEQGYGYLLARRAHNLARKRRWEESRAHDASVTVTEPLRTGAEPSAEALRTGELDYTRLDYTRLDSGYSNGRLAPAVASEPTTPVVAQSTGTVSEKGPRRKTPTAGIARLTPKNAEQFATLCSLFGYAEGPTFTANERGKVNNAAKQLSGYDRPQIERMYGVWSSVFPNAVCTPLALASHATLLLRGRQTRDGMPSGTREQVDAEYARGAMLVLDWDAPVGQQVKLGGGQ